MKVYITLTNPKGNKKGMGSDSRALAELTYKNKVIGTIGLYPIIDGDEDLGYRVVWGDPTVGGMAKVIKEEEKKGKMQTGERKCGYAFNGRGCNKLAVKDGYCDFHQ